MSLFTLFGEENMLLRLAKNPLAWIVLCLHLTIVVLSGIGYEVFANRMRVEGASFSWILHPRLWFFIFAAHTFALIICVSQVAERTVADMSATEDPGKIES